jgi:transcriptional regulator with XRE-family HTH domain
MSSQRIIGERIKFYRIERGLTQRQLEDELGVAPRYISSIECGSRGASLDMLAKICRHFRISMADLMPVDIPAVVSPKDKLIGEIVSVLRTLEINQIGVVKSTAYALCS